MKNVVILGGASGIGLALAEHYMIENRHVFILDKNKPPLVGNYTYFYCDLLNYNLELFSNLAHNEGIDSLIITAGFGRVADFEHLHISEIDALFKVNTVSTIKVISAFYSRIKAKNSFNCAVIGSIAGLVSSPVFSVYAASKAAVFRFVESVNAELAGSGYSNRILNVSPGSIKGTSFNGGDNQLELLRNLSTDIIQHLNTDSELFIPEYDAVYKNVLERYKNDPLTFGLDSYEYKKASNRITNKRQAAIGYMSGTFDLFHVGHLNIIIKAKSQCDYLIVGVHESGKHKGKESFIPFDERKAIVSSIQYVDQVVTACTEDDDAWDIHHFDKLFVGSDYKGTKRFEKYAEYFSDKNVEITFFPYTQSTSSTQIRDLITKMIN